VEFLYNEILMKYGAPYEVISDRDKAFLEAAMPHYEEYLRIRHLPSTSYHPRTNGMVERMHQMLNHGIRTLEADHLDRWDEFLPQIVFALRTRTHAVTGHSPFFLVHGIEPRLPIDTNPPREIMAPLNELERMEEQAEFNARDFEALGLARRAAMERSFAQAARMSARQPPDASTHRFEIGDQVKMKIINRHKYDQHWAGPFTIARLATPGVYYLLTLRGSFLDTPVNEERLAPWHGRSPDIVDTTDNEELLEFLRRDSAVSSLSERENPVSAQTAS
jgi:hypothetical protein